MSQAEKIAHLEAEIKKAKEKGDEYYLKYLMRIMQQTINVYEGGVVIFQSGSPKPPPPYGGGG